MNTKHQIVPCETRITESDADGFTLTNWLDDREINSYRVTYMQCVTLSMTAREVVLAVAMALQTQLLAQMKRTGGPVGEGWTPTLPARLAGVIEARQ